jgi:hypothetical protein
MPEWQLSTWSEPPYALSEVLGVHAGLLPTGRVLIFSGDEADRDLHNRGDYDHTRLYLPESNSVIACQSPSTDVFCCGHAALGDGRLIVAGGIQDTALTDYFWVGSGHHLYHAPGSRATWAFEPKSETWARLADMNPGPLDSSVDPAKAELRGGRWYPSLLTLPTGEVLAVSGHPGEADARHHNHTPEILPANPRRGDAWASMPDAGDPVLHENHTYPRLHALPNGLVFSVTPFNPTGMSCIYDPVTGDVTEICVIPFDPSDPPDSRGNVPLQNRLYPGYHCASVLLPLRPPAYRPRVLICNGEQAHLIDLDAAQPTWKSTGPRTLQGSRWNATSVLLPTGEVLVVGGVRSTQGADGGQQLLDANAQLQPELYDPAADRWTTLSAAKVPRNYHSVALLLPDGRVFTAGSAKDAYLGAAAAEKRIEIFEPWYCKPSTTRPVILESPPVVHPGGTFRLRVSTTSPIERVAIVRTGTVTHCYNSDQRYVELSFKSTGQGDFVVDGPPNSRIAPPGYYLLFALNADGAPSVGHFVRIPPPPHWSRWARLSDAAKTTPGAVVSAVSSVPGGVSLFVADREGAVQTSYFDPRVANPEWSAWARLSDAAKTTPGAVVSAVSSVPGGVSLFVADREGAVQTSYFDPRIALVP